MTHACTNKRCQSLRGRALGLLVSCQLNVKESGCSQATRNAWTSGTADKNDPCTHIWFLCPSSFSVSLIGQNSVKDLCLTNNFLPPPPTNHFNIHEHPNRQPVSGGNIWIKPSALHNVRAENTTIRLQLHHQDPTAYKTGL